MKKIILIITIFITVISCTKKELAKEVADEPYVGKWEYIKFTVIGANINITSTLSGGSYLILNKDKSYEAKITGGTFSGQSVGNPISGSIPASQETGTCDVLSDTEIVLAGETFQITKLTQNELVFKQNKNGDEATYYYKK